MLRACRQILRSGGRIGGYVIHAPTGLTEEEKRHAADAGPPDVLAAVSPDEQLEAAGLEVVVHEDVTSAYRGLSERTLEASLELEEELRSELGDAAFDERIEQRRGAIAAIDRGLLLRSLLVGEKRG